MGGSLQGNGHHATITSFQNPRTEIKEKSNEGFFLFHNFNDAVNDNFLAIKRSLDKCCTIYANPLYRLQPHSLLHEATSEDYFIHAKEEQEEEALEVYEQFECCHKKMVKTFQTSAKRQCTFQLDSKNSFFTVIVIFHVYVCIINAK